MTERQRLIEAMAEIATEEGYGAASVTKVTHRARVPRTRFYEYFRDRTSCFEVIYRQSLADLVAQMPPEATRAGTEAWTLLLSTALDALASEPRASRMVLIEALGTDPSFRAKHERLVESAESHLEAGSRSQNPGLLLSGSALLGGLSQPVSTQVLSDAPLDSSGLTRGLFRWLGSYEVRGQIDELPARLWEKLGNRIPAAPPTEVRQSLQHQLSEGSLFPARAEEHRRLRVETAMTQLMVERGYGGVCVNDILGSARISRAAFYSLFSSKEEVYLGALTTALRGSMAAAASSYFIPNQWSERVWDALEAFLRYVGSHSELAHLAMVEVHSAGPQAVKRSQENLMAFTFFLIEGYEISERFGKPVPLISEAVAGAVFGLIRREILRGRREDLVELLPQVAFIVLAPFMGADEALAFAHAKLEQAGPGAPIGSERRFVMTG